MSSGEQRLWVEKYRPLTFEQAGQMHQETIDMLSSLAQSDNFPHILFYGPSGSGKRSLTKALLHALYDSNAVHRIKAESKEFKISATSSTTCSCIVFSSNYHLEVTPSEADSHDRVIVQKLIKEVAGSQQLDSKTQKTFKVVVIHEIDNLTQQAQASLRRTMETYMPYCRIIANAESLSKVIQPVRSRCLQIRVPAPSEEKITKMLKQIATKEGFELPATLAMNIAHNSRRNLRRAIMMLQTTKLKTDKLQASTQVPRPDYETFICDIAREVLREQSPMKLRQIRSQIYELLTKGISADMIFQTIVREFLKNEQSKSTLPEPIKPEVLRFAVMFELRCREGAKAIIHLEAFLARVMALYKGYQISISRGR